MGNNIWDIEDEDYAARRRKLAFWLRHKPESGGLTLDENGWVDCEAIIAALERTELPTPHEQLLAIVRGDPKHRFELEDGRLRARFGHSLELTAPLVPGMPPASLFYGVSPKYAAKVSIAGIEPVRRQHVHLATSRSGAAEVATRRGVVGWVFRVDAHAAYNGGVAFYPRGRGIWLSEPIPPQFLEPVGQHSETDDDSQSDTGAHHSRRPQLGPRKFATPKHRRRRK